MSTTTEYLELDEVWRTCECCEHTTPDYNKCAWCQLTFCGECFGNSKDDNHQRVCEGCIVDARVEARGER